jgi:hypothetical protein
LFATMPQLALALAHAVPSSVQPQPLAPPVPPLQVFGGAQVLGQVMFCPQLLVAGPHALPLQALVLSGVQQVLLWQTPALGQVAGQETVWPQLLVTVVLQAPAQAVALSGVQHVPSDLHTSLDDAQLTVPPAPHDTDCPQLFIAVPHVFPAHVVATGSGTQPQAPPVQASPPSQPGQVTV